VAINRRDAIEPAIAALLGVMQRHGVTRIMTFDHGFDGVPGVVRLGDSR
jgi:predicted nucleic acid-binding protein